MKPVTKQPKNLFVFFLYVKGDLNYRLTPCATDTGPYKTHNRSVVYH